MSGRSRSGRVAILTVVCAAAVAFQYATASLPSPLEPPLEAWQAASLGPESPSLRWAAPLAGTPRASGAPPLALVARLLPPPAHRGEVAWRLLAAALAAGCAASIALALRAAGCFPLAAGAAALVLPLAGVFRGDPFSQVESSLAAALLAASWLASLRFRSGGAWTTAGLAVVLLALAVDCRLSWLPLALPAWVLLAGADAARTRRLAVSAVLIAALLVAVAHSLAAAWLTLAATPAAPGRAGGPPALSHVLALAVSGPTAAGRAGGAVSGVIALGRAAHAVFGLLGLALVAAALGLTRRAATTSLAVAASAAALCALAALSGPVEASPPVLALLLCGAMALGAGADCVLKETRGAARLVAAALVVLAAALPAARAHTPEARASARSRDVSRDALASALTARAAVVADLPPIDRAVLPLPALERVPPDPRVVRRFADAGSPVLAFDRSRREMEARGFSFTRLPLACASLGAYLSALPPGAIVGLASTSGSPVGPHYAPAAGAASLGARERTGAWLTRALCLVGVAGATEGAREAIGEENASLRAAANEVVSDRGAIVPATLSLAADGTKARVEAEGRWYVESGQGLAIAALDGLGNLWDARVVDDTTGFKIAPPDDRFAASRLDPREPGCAVVPPNGSVDLSGLARSAAVGWSLDGPGAGSLELFAFADTGLAPGGGENGREVHVDSFEPGDHALARELASAGLAGRGLPGVPAARLTIPLHGRPSWGTATFGAVPRLVLAATRGAGAGPVRVCSAGVGPDVLFADEAQRAADLVVGRHRDPRFGAGWYGREYDGATPFRWTGERAVLLLRSAPVSALRVIVLATAAARGGPPVEVTLAVNGRSLPPCAATGDPTRCEWLAGDGAWVDGLNQLELHVSRSARIGADSRVLGIAVRGVRLERVE